MKIAAPAISAATLENFKYFPVKVQLFDSESYGCRLINPATNTIGYTLFNKASEEALLLGIKQTGVSYNQFIALVC